MHGSLLTDSCGAMPVYHLALSLLDRRITRASARVRHLQAALSLTVAGVVLAFCGLLLPGGEWAHVTSGAATIAFSLPAGALTTFLVFQD